MSDNTKFRIPTLESERIRLRDISRADARSIYENAKEPAISRYTFVPRPYTLSNAYDFIRLRRKWHRTGTVYSFGIEIRETGQIVGMIGLHRCDFANRNAELGYWLGEKYWGKGIALEAITRILEYSIRDLKLVRVYARVMHPNIASARLLQKAGFSLEGRFRKAVLHRGRWMDYLSYAILADEFRLKSKIRKRRVPI